MKRIWVQLPEWPIHAKLHPYLPNLATVARSIFSIHDCATCISTAVPTVYDAVINAASGPSAYSWRWAALNQLEPLSLP